LLELVPVPAGVVTLIVPDIAPEGTVAVIWVEELTVKLADLLLNLTVVAPVKLAPVIVTTVPTGPVLGEKVVIHGATVKLEVLVTVPAGVVTLMRPVVAADGTVAIIRQS
jgi:hypothetical protein